MVGDGAGVLSRRGRGQGWGWGTEQGRGWGGASGVGARDGAGVVGSGQGRDRGTQRVEWGSATGASWCQPAFPPAPQDLFFHYVFNNFLHTQVEVCISAMLSTGPPSDSSLEMPAPNPVVKHVSWGSQVSPSSSLGWVLSQVCPLPVMQPVLGE